MKRFAKSGLLMVLAMALFGIHQGYVSAQEAQTLATKHVLLGTIITGGFPAITLPPGGTYTAVDAPQTVNCPGTTNCTIQADQSAVTTSGTTTNNQAGTCLVIDGNINSVGCFYSGTTPSDGTPVTGTTSQSVSVPHGNHTVQTMAFSNHGAFLEYYNTTYRIYRP